ncbi:hypothetical protein [Meiothermus taiwanensis]|uniref:Uncharacterized protein n=1 Tax=Meiothermus taiwanensis TaxID=172827 RepID=A0A399E9U9_9DEIN|nr:hypothetical protein [Meiothermus taiwanensis]RIH79051.1 hypothetical protein Mcate_00564 [Meiothermus taiwanensis]
MDKRIVIPRIVVRPILPPPLEIGARIRPQWLNWQVGRYREKLSFGPGGKGKADIWVPEREGEQHNLILTQFYNSLIPQYGFIGSSQYAAVGTGSTAPDATQTQLVNEIGSSGSPRRTNSVPTGESNEIEALATYGEYNIRRVFEFTEAQVGGLNLTEWGFSPVNTYNGPLMTRELFRDGLGNPIVLTLDTDRRLRLIYRYKVTVSPTSAQDVSVNIGGDGPGIRTAKFLPTGMFSTLDSLNTHPNVNYFGILLSSANSTYRQRRGDIVVVDALARGGSIAGVGSVGFSSNAAPLTYIHTTNKFTTNSPNKALSYSSPSGSSRQASVLLQTTEHVITIKSVILNGNLYTNSSAEACPTINLVFDNGQEFTKDNLHKLLIAYWQITWQP